MLHGLYCQVPDELRVRLGEFLESWGVFPQNEREGKELAGERRGKFIPALVEFDE